MATVRTLTAPMPALTVPGGYKLKFEAISPTTGAAVTGVKVGTIAVYGYDQSDGAVVPTGRFYFTPVVAGQGG